MSDNNLLLDVFWKQSGLKFPENKAYLLVHKLLLNFVKTSYYTIKNSHQNLIVHWIFVATFKPALRSCLFLEVKNNETF